ncbi:hypothetical protein [Leekyejoonella antrihumi]|uniref:Uncharacterized protein n=1 Tax=Leekyejoonella antrihumi TaxID=1660198 RepID=A0A563E4P2_9MICO|nr:hypothetical protein [Leekyejoonella antrihumi]TWP37202.1 hypothetical protein FGL98_07265 [Leekyejoonella antrihumi]
MSERPAEEQTGGPVLSDSEAERVRRRVRLLVDITSTVGVYRTGLKLAASRLTKGEATVIADLETHGLDVAQLREVLCGAHVLVDDPDLYTSWRFPKTHERLSSHHKNIDKKQYPDLGLKGPLVREKLHGRTKTGTWVQLEKTPAAMGDGFHLPTFNDFLHLCDYVVYRFTKSNVGPWGLSKQTERHPVYLSPGMSSTVPVPAYAEAELTRALAQVEEQDDTTSASPDLARRFPPPERRDTLAELVLRPKSRNGRGLFGASEVYAKGAPPAVARTLLDEARVAGQDWSLPEAGDTAATTVRGGKREIRCAMRRVPASDQQKDD